MTNAAKLAARLRTLAFIREETDCGRIHDTHTTVPGFFERKTDWTVNPSAIVGNVEVGLTSNGIRFFFTVTDRVVIDRGCTF